MKPVSFLCFFLLLCASLAMAKEYIGPSDRFAMMKKIQGTWRGPCVPGPGGFKMGYDKQTLKISFTHIKIEVDRYASSKCVKKIGEFTQRYLYNIGAPAHTKIGEPVFELNLKSDNKTETGVEAPDALNWDTANIIQYQDGALYFGRARAIKKPERLQALDRTLAYQR